MDRQELNKYRDKVWLTVKDVGKVAQVGYATARKIVDQINENREGKYYIPSKNSVPSHELFKFLGLDKF